MNFKNMYKNKDFYVRYLLHLVDYFVKISFTGFGTKLLMNAAHSDRSEIGDCDPANERKTTFEEATVLS